MVRQLVDAISDGFCGENGLIEEQIVLGAPASPLSSDHYGGNADPRLASFSREWLSALVPEGEKGSGPGIFFPKNLRWNSLAQNGTGNDSPEVALEDLLLFFRDPVRYFLTREMGLSSGRRPSVLEEEEPFLVLEDRIMGQWVRGGPPETGILPWPPLREIFRDRLARRLRLHEKEVFRWKEGEGRRMSVDVNLGKTRIHGVIDAVRDREGAALLFVDRWPGTLYAQDVLGTFLCHLLLLSVRSGAGTTLVFGKSRGRDGKRGEDELWKWISSSPEMARKLLGRYVRAFRTGIRQPLPFDPEISLFCAEKARTAGKEFGLSPSEIRRRSLQTAERKLKELHRNRDFPKGKGQSPGWKPATWSSLAFSGRDWIFEPDFYRWARLIWDPVLDMRSLLENPATPDVAGLEQS
jgi:exonuclease V gamma subunit